MLGQAGPLPTLTLQQRTRLRAAWLETPAQNICIITPVTLDALMWAQGKRQAKWGPQTVCINKALLAHGHAHSLVY